MNDYDFDSKPSGGKIILPEEAKPYRRRRPILAHPIDGCTRCRGTRGEAPGEEVSLAEFDNRILCCPCASELLNKGEEELTCPVCYRDLVKHKWIPWDVMKEEMDIGNLRTVCMDDKSHDMLLCVHNLDDNPCDEEFMREISS